MAQDSALMSTSRSVDISNAALSVQVRIDSNGLAHTPDIRCRGRDSSAPLNDNDVADAGLPLVELKLNGIGNHTGTAKPSKGLVGGLVSTRLRYVSHRTERVGDELRLDVDLADADTGVAVTSHLTLMGDEPVLRSSVSIRNDGAKRVVLHSLPSLVLGGISPEGAAWWDEYEVVVPSNTWFREAQWRAHTMDSVGLGDIGLAQAQDNHNKESMATYSVSNRSTFSTQGYLPMGMLRSAGGEGASAGGDGRGDLVLWQIENNGAWRWDIGDHGGRLYLATSGPEAGDHDWRLTLESGETYRTPFTAVYRGPDDVDAAFAALTAYRRMIIRPHDDYETLPVIFNDYMNCLMGDPTEDKILALLPHVEASGAEYFVIDAGWYADDGDWWDDVGAWEPSARRFPSGFKRLLDQIRERGLRPGVWVEPEVIGVRCALADTLPHEAFMQRDGDRIVERGRYHLDFRHPAAVRHLTEVVARCVDEYGVRYFKFDYNIEHVLGTDVQVGANANASAKGNRTSPGVGQAQHGQAYRAWISYLLDRWPGLVIENCSSGGMRMEYDMLSVHTLQSTSDQQDPALYAAIAAGLPTAVLPLQGATWAYPQPAWSDEMNALTVANSLFGRVHLSGRLDLLDERQKELIVYEGMRVYAGIKSDVLAPGTRPFWPLGLPKWADTWLALGMRVSGSRALVMVWKREGAGGKRGAKAGKSKDLPIKALDVHRKGDTAAGVRVQLLYPKALPATAEWIADESVFRVGLEPDVCARLFELVVE